MLATRIRKCLIVAFLLLSAGTLYIGANIAPAGGAQPTNPESVVITDDRVAPTTVTIVDGGKVTWKNNGTSAHAVVAKNNAFLGFTLQPTGDPQRALPKGGALPVSC